MIEFKTDAEWKNYLYKTKFKTTMVRWVNYENDYFCSRNNHIIVGDFVIIGDKDLSYVVKITNIKSDDLSFGEDFYYKYYFFKKLHYNKCLECGVNDYWDNKKDELNGVVFNVKKCLNCGFELLSDEEFCRLSNIIYKKSLTKHK